MSLFLPMRAFLWCRSCSSRVVSMASGCRRPREVGSAYPDVCEGDSIQANRATAIAQQQATTIPVSAMNDFSLAAASKYFAGEPTSQYHFLRHSSHTVPTFDILLSSTKHSTASRIATRSTSFPARAGTSIHDL
jgi:hypothetical protein